MAATAIQGMKATVREGMERIWKEGDLSFIDEHFADTYVGHDPSFPE